MMETPLNKLKNKALFAASAAVLRVELATEEAKLKKNFQTLGLKVHGAVRDDLLAAIKDDPSVVELLGAIEERKRRIKTLERRINNPGEDEEA
ncbi:MAG: hypothetical protein MJZ25_13280 [Fibrobacter sp.]|nr:hypothetical protein [Fibrobacter sp.]